MSIFQINRITVVPF
uniref:Uncharacterized protein n=1 Tax=Arundo donax TaxID=35708 RepID=A0A0A9A4S3_ARUDO